MDTYSERTHQGAIRSKLRSRSNGFRPFVLDGTETIPRMFSSQARLHPHKPAIVHGNESLTYEELDRLASDICQAIIGLPDLARAPIAVMIGRYPNFLASILGVLRSGAFYIPLDPSFPEDRNTSILRAAQPPVILSERVNQTIVERLVAPEQTVVYVDEIERGLTVIQDRSDPDGLACIVYTSGSTGRPKGVMQTHRNVLQVVARYASSLHLGDKDRVSLLSSCSVTASVATFLGSLLNGADLRAFSVLEGGLSRLADWLEAEQITVYDSAPSLFRHLMKSVPQDKVFSNVQVVRLVSDSAYRTDWELFTQHFTTDSVLVNHYGCSEMSTVSGFYMDSMSRPQGSVLPVGFPLDGVEIYVADERGTSRSLREHLTDNQPVIAGEIVLQSRYLSPGYWNDALTTEGAFFVHPSDNRVRVYKTGDVGTIREHQGLVHLGRDDSQVKLSGFRVEIAEVEGCLRSYPGLAEAALMSYTADHGERELIGFVVMSAGDHCSGADIRRFIQERLPAHMVPSEILVIDTIPCTPNGKIDRSALLRLREDAWKNRTRRVPSTRTEQVLSEIWTQLLNLQEVGVDDDFFELDGNSLLAMRLLSRISETFDVQLNIRAVFQYPTIRQLAELVEKSTAPRRV